MVNYKIKIVVDKFEQIQKINRILSIQSSSENVWVYETIVDDNEPYIDYVYIFSEKLEHHLNELKEIGITTSDVTIWMEYEYDQQCNMEFFPNQLKKLGDLGIKLCISCWQKDGYIYFD